MKNLTLYNFIFIGVKKSIDQWNIGSKNIKLIFFDKKGYNEYQGSEHLIDNKKYPLEVNSWLFI